MKKEEACSVKYYEHCNELAIHALKNDNKCFDCLIFKSPEFWKSIL